MTSYPIRPEVRGFDPYSPGLSIDEIRQRFGLESVVKMASNENPLGASPQVAEAVRRHAARVFRYAAPGTPRLTAALAARHGLDAAQVVAGNGSDEIIDLLLRVCPVPGTHNVVASRPSFSMYRLQSRLCGVEFREAPLREDFSFDWQGLLAAVDERTALVFVTTPDNPSGYCPEKEQVEAFARALPPTCLLVVDEAYMDFCDDERSLLGDFAAHPNLVIVRTFSKSYGLAGLRLGYGLMPVELAAHMQSVHPPFSVNLLAEEAGLAALADTAFREATMAAVRSGRAFLAAELGDLGCRVFPSQANFLMFGLPPTCPKSARQVFDELLSRGLIVRPLAGYGLPDYLRVSVGAPQENRIFIALLREALDKTNLD